MFTDFLSESYICVAASSVEEAFEYLSENEFSLVITDVTMSELSGIELLRKVVESYSNTPVVMISGINQPQFALDAIRLGAFDYLFKPCGLEMLEITVERALEQHAFLRNARRNELNLQAQNAELADSKAQLERLQTQIVHSQKTASFGELAAEIADELTNPAGLLDENLERLKQYVTGLKKLLIQYETAELQPDDNFYISAIKEKIDYQNLLMDLDAIISDCNYGTRHISHIIQNLQAFS